MLLNYFILIKKIIMNKLIMNKLLKNCAYDNMHLKSYF